MTFLDSADTHFRQGCAGSPFHRFWHMVFPPPNARPQKPGLFF
jgi:hypothetical protein